ncbi:MAG: hypothetical protein AAB473_02910 [Patescibacteria group bacterium]
MKYVRNGTNTYEGIRYDEEVYRCPYCYSYVTESIPKKKPTE